MKRNITLLLLFFAHLSNIVAQTCPNGQLILKNQAEVNAFPTNYPGCQTLDVRFEVNDEADATNDITDLTPLSQLQSSNNHMYVHFNPLLETLDGLQNLTTINGDFTIESNPMLTDLSGLEGMTTVTELLKIKNNTGLTTLSGFGSGSPFTNFASLVILGNSSLVDMDDPFNNLETVEEYILFYDNDALTAVNTMDNVTTVGQYFSLEDNASLTSINGFGSLTTVGNMPGSWNFDVVGNPNLLTLNDFTSLQSVDARFQISECFDLTSLSFPTLNSIGGNLIIGNNTSLTSLLGLGDFTLGGQLFITGNSALPECEAEGICDYLDGPGPATINSNAPGCNSVAQVETACAAAPVEMMFFNGKNTTAGVLLNWRTATELNNDYFVVEHSRHGNHFQTLGRVEGNGTTLAVSNYQYEHRDPPAGINYYRLKQVDTDGKFHYSPIVTVTVKRSAELEIYPNPTTGFVKLQGDLPAGTARLTDLSGKVIEEIRLPDYHYLDLTGQANGVYLVEIQTGEETLVKRVVKQK